MNCVHVFVCTSSLILLPMLVMCSLVPGSDAYVLFFCFPHFDGVRVILFLRFYLYHSVPMRFDVRMCAYFSVVVSAVVRVCV